MTDIVERLEDRKRHPSTLALRQEAAQEIRRLRDALTYVVGMNKSLAHHPEVREALYE